MGLFDILFKSEPEPYSEDMDKLGREIAIKALKQMKEYDWSSYCYITDLCGGGDIEICNGIQRLYERNVRYIIDSHNYGRERVEPKNAYSFLRRVMPYVETRIKKEFRSFFSNEYYSSVRLINDYFIPHNRTDDEYIYAIEMEVGRIKKIISPSKAPSYKNW